MSSPSDAAKSARPTKPHGLKSSTKDTIEGTARSVAGMLKEETGKALGNPKLQAEGAVDQFVGKIQRNIGDIKKALGS